MANFAVGSKLTLKDFLEGYPPPQYGRIIDGLPRDIQEQSGIAIGTGTVLRFHRKVNPNVPISFKDPWSDNSDHFIKVTLPVDFPGKFKILSYDPISGDQSEDHIFRTVEDLIASFPVFIQANASYANNTENPEFSFDCGDRLKLVRLIYRDGIKLLECRRIRETRLLMLPMDCVGDFTIIPSENEYLLADLVSMLPRKRRVKLCSDQTIKQMKIPGLPSNFKGDLFVEELEYFVEASPTDEESLIIGLPHDLEMTVAPGNFERGLLLNSFATNNRNLFPVVACVTDWDEETTILENHFIKPGVELVIHGWTRQSKILARSGDAYFAIPLTYQGCFAIQPQQFTCVSDLEHVHPGYKLRVLEVDHSETNFPLSRGDVIRIKRGDSIKKKKHGEVKFLKCEKFSLTGTVKVKDVKLPINASVRFEEILEDTKNHEFHIKELVSFVSDQEVNVVLKRGSPDQKVPERDLPLHDAITLCDFVIEPAIYVSVDSPEAPAFHVPLRSLIYVSFVEQLDKASSPLLTKISPKLSTLDRCIEILPDQIFQQLLRKAGDGNHFPTFHGATAFSGPSSASAWNGVSATQLQGDALDRVRAPSFAESDVRMSTLPSPAKQEAMINRKYRSTENVFKESRNQEGLPEMRSSGLAVSRGITARAYSTGGQGLSNGQLSPTHSQNFRLPDSHYVTRRDTGSMYGGSVHGGSVHGASQYGASSPPSSPPANVQLPPGYVLMPTAQAQAIPAGYTLVPVMQPHGYSQMGSYAGSHMGSQMGSHMGSIQRLHSPSVVDDDSDFDDTASDVSRFSFSKPPSFKVSIPPDGNLYHFSAKKFCELLRLLKIEEASIKACNKDKIDGKKFSRMTDVQMDRYGLVHPIIFHFRRHTDKKKASSKFAL